MIYLRLDAGRLVVEAENAEFAPRHLSQLSYWGLQSPETSQQWISPIGNTGALATKIRDYFARNGVSIQLDEALEQLLVNEESNRRDLETARQKGELLKQGSIPAEGLWGLQNFCERQIARQLRDHQFKATLHFLTVGNGANFSVPGSGKTTVILTAFQYLKRQGIVDSLFVVGPPACFAPWRNEYSETLGVTPNYVTLAGGDAESRRTKYVADADSVADLYLTSFHTFSRDWEKVATLFSNQGVNFLFVIDEAHYIKQLGGVWASAVLNVSRFAARRCILTGTPFPKDYSDAFNLFDFLWPDCPPIPQGDKHKIAFHSKNKDYGKASELLDRDVGGLFYRVRKADLNLAPQVFHDPVLVDMSPHEKRIHDAILDRVIAASEEDYFRDLDLLTRLKRGRMIRLRQCLSYVRLLTSAIPGYQEDLIEDDLSLASTIYRYDELELPGKIIAATRIIEELLHNGEKVVIWSNFVGTLQLLERTVRSKGYRGELIYGATPVEQAGDEADVLTREMIIQEFIRKDSGLDILIANPAACAESISLHKTCSNAIYYDLSYNCAQYLQSLDRIHRVGGSEHKPSYYHFLQYRKSLDQDVLENVRAKAQRMSQIIDQEYPLYSLDMFDDDDELVAYERLFSSDHRRI